MSYEEKSTWAFLATTILTGVVYALWVLPQLSDSDVSEVSYVGPMIGAFVVAILATIVLQIVIAASAPSEADKRDERDKRIIWRGDRIGGYVLSVAVAGVLLITWMEVEYFWIANAIFLAFLLQSIVSASVKLTAYRAGF